MISGGDDADQQKDGDYLSHAERYARTDEYVDILKRIWTADRPVDHEGRYYRFKGAFSDVKPVQQPHIPIYFGGSSDAATEVAGRHADIYALWGETLAQVEETVAKVRAAAAPHGQSPRFSLSIRPILAATEAAAWAKAEAILAETKRVRGQAMLGAAPDPANAARSASWRRQPRARWSTSACGPRSPPRPARAATPPPWSAPMSRSQNRCSPITIWA
nr:LLM class flavin-dependent oxidoreductase [Geminicoccus harenae]